MKVKKTAIVYHKSDLDGVVSAAIATMYENSKNKDVVYIPYSEPILKQFSKSGLMKERA